MEYTVKPGSQQCRVRKSRTNFYSSVGVQTGTWRRATVWNGFEPASSELRDVARHIVNSPLLDPAERTEYESKASKKSCTTSSEHIHQFSYSLAMNPTLASTAEVSSTV